MKKLISGISVTANDFESNGADFSINLGIINKYYTDVDGMRTMFIHELGHSKHFGLLITDDSFQQELISTSHDGLVIHLDKEFDAKAKYPKIRQKTRVLMKYGFIPKI